MRRRNRAAIFLRARYKAANSTAEQQIDQVQQAKKETIKAGKVCAIGAKKTMTVGNPGGKVASVIAFVTGKIKGKLQGKNGAHGQPSSGDGAKSH